MIQDIRPTILLSLDQRKNVSFAIWVPFAWYAIAASRSLSRWLNLSYVHTFNQPVKLNYLEGSPIDRTFYSVLILIGIFILVSRRIEWHKMLKDNIWLAVILCFMLLSIFWSQFPAVTLKRWIRLLAWKKYHGTALALLQRE